jgi:hypothetical protein
VKAKAKARAMEATTLTPPSPKRPRATKHHKPKGNSKGTHKRGNPRRSSKGDDDDDGDDNEDDDSAAVGRAVAAAMAPFAEVLSSLARQQQAASAAPQSLPAAAPMSRAVVPYRAPPLQAIPAPVQHAPAPAPLTLPASPSAPGSISASVAPLTQPAAVQALAWQMQAAAEHGKAQLYMHAWQQQQLTAQAQIFDTMAQQAAEVAGAHLGVDQLATPQVRGGVVSCIHSRCVVCVRWLQAFSAIATTPAVAGPAVGPFVIASQVLGGLPFVTRRVTFADCCVQQAPVAADKRKRWRQ